MLTTITSMWLSGALLLGLALYVKRSAKARLPVRAAGRRAQSRRGTGGR